MIISVIYFLKYTTWEKIAGSSYCNSAASGQQQAQRFEKVHRIRPAPRYSNIIAVEREAEESS
jgi:hypothetical protein